jgi:hypothetical protein
MSTDGAEDPFWSIVALMVVLGLSAVAAATYGCSDGGRAAAVLQREGYSKIKTDGWSPFGCGDDPQCTKFEAVGPGGAPVSGVVGCGWWFKACTVRIISR